MSEHGRSPCHEFQLNHDAIFALSGDHSIVETFGDATAEAQAVISTAGIFDLCHEGIIKITGPDRVDFLHRITTAHIKSLQHGMGANGALLNANGTVVSLFRIFHCGDHFLMILAPEILHVTLEFLERFHFAEKIQFEKISQHFGIISVQGPQSRHFLESSLGIHKLPSAPLEHTNGHVAAVNIRIFQVEDFDLPGFYVLLARDQVAAVYQEFYALGKKEGVHLAGRLAAEWLRLEKGIPVYGIDVNQTNIILEARLDRYVHDNKGCYPGQEVVERIRTYGEVAKKLVGIEINSPFPLKPGDKIVADGKEVGFVTSSARPAWRDHAIGLAYIRRGFNKPDSKYLALGDHGRIEGVEVTVVF